MKIVSFISGIITLFMSFSSLGQKVPKTWDPSMKIQASYGGGMMYYSYEIIITDTSAYMNILSSEGKKDYNRKFTVTELNAILKYLSDHNFDKIKSDFTGLTHDKASESILLSWDNEFIGVSESSSMSVKDEYRGDFRLIQAYLQGLFEKK